MIKSRIKILDSFRALSILSVMLFHFFSRWTVPLNAVTLYPYKNDYDYFRWGYLGVEFFFMISGFVIFFTLDNTKSFLSFWIKRLIRLLPPIIVASIITYAIFTFFDANYTFSDSHSAINFIPSITLIHPNLLNILFSKFNIELHYLSNSYWSLWPELQFYFLSSVLYYIDKKGFIKNFILISILLIVGNFIIQHSNDLNINLSSSFLTNYTKWTLNRFNLINYLHFFCIGVLFYSLFKNKQNNAKTPIFIKICIVFFTLFIVNIDVNLASKVLYGVMFLLFYLFIYFPDKLGFLENKTLGKIGESSYFLYLIHEHTGVLIIYSFAIYFAPLGWLFTLFTMAVLITLSYIYTFTVDKKINHWLKQKLIKEEPKAKKKPQLAKLDL